MRDNTRHKSFFDFGARTLHNGPTGETEIWHGDRDRAHLSGLGDLTVTCFSPLSRNCNFGQRLGRGEKIGDILFRLTAVAEGYHTVCYAHQLAQKLGVTVPIISEVYAMLYDGKDAGQALRDLLSRDGKAED